MTEENPYAPPSSMVEVEMGRVARKVRRVGLVRVAAKHLFLFGLMVEFCYLFAGRPLSDFIISGWVWSGLVFCLAGVGLRVLAWRLRVQLLREGQWKDPLKNAVYQKWDRQFNKIILRVLVGMFFLAVSYGLLRKLLGI